MKSLSDLRTRIYFENFVVWGRVYAHTAGRICAVIINFTILIVFQKPDNFSLFLNRYSNSNNSITTIRKICQNRIMADFRICNKTERNKIFMVLVCLNKIRPLFHAPLGPACIPWELPLRLDITNSAVENKYESDITTENLSNIFDRARLL